MTLRAATHASCRLERWRKMASNARQETRGPAAAAAALTRLLAMTNCQKMMCLGDGEDARSQEAIVAIIEKLVPKRTFFRRLHCHHLQLAKTHY